MSPLFLLILLWAPHGSRCESNLTLTAGEEKMLQDAYQVIVHNFQYRRHEWSFSAVKYAGFLHFFGSSWRLVTRFGGTYAFDGSSYYNRWNWNEALETLFSYLEDLEKYHRVYRHLSWPPGEGGSTRVQFEWYRRYPQHRQDAMLFIDFMSHHSGQLLSLPGYLATGEQQAARLRDLLQLANAGNTCQVSGATRQLLDLALLVVRATSAQTDAILYASPEEPSADRLVAIATNYTELSQLAWDRMPSLALNASLDPHCLAANVSIANISDSAAWLSRQVLGHVLLYLRHLQLVRWQLNKQQAISLAAMYCRVAREDVDKELERHLEAKEVVQLEQLLESCWQVEVTRGAAYTEMEALWRRLRTRISREYSAFQQYSNRIPAILQAKAIVKFGLPAIATVGVALNLLITLYYARHAKVRRVGRNFLIALLACFDTAILLTSCIVLFTDRYMEHNQELKPTPVTDLWCKFQTYLLNLAVESSAFTVVILSVERFLAVYSLFRQPVAADQTHKELPLRKLSIMALCAFCFACIFNCMLIIGDEVAAPAKSTIGRQCVHYVRLNNFHANLIFVTRVKPVLNALVRSLLPYSLVCLLSLATCWLLFKKGAYQSLHRQEQEAGGRPDGQLARALGQLGLAFAYLVLTAPAPVVYTLFMTAHADRLMIKLTNGLYDEVDPVFRTHWSRIGRLTVAQYVTEYVMVPLSASINFCVFYLTDVNFRRYVSAALTCSSSWRQTNAGQEELADSPEPAQQQQQQRLQQQRLQQQQQNVADDWEQTEII